MKLIRGNLYQIGGNKPGPAFTHPESSATYVLTNTEHTEAIGFDPGLSEGYPALVKNLGKLGMTIPMVDDWYFGHCHEDHVTAAREIKRDNPNARFHVHWRDAWPLFLGSKLWQFCDFYETEKGVRITEGLRPFLRDFKRSLGEATIQAIHMPGHTRGSVAYGIKQPEGSDLILSDAGIGGLNRKTVIFVNHTINKWDRSFAKAMKTNYDNVHVGHDSDEPWDNTNNQALSRMRQAITSPMILPSVPRRPIVSEMVEVNPGESVPPVALRQIRDIA